MEGEEGRKNAWKERLDELLVRNFITKLSQISQANFKLILLFRSRFTYVGYVYDLKLYYNGIIIDNYTIKTQEIKHKRDYGQPSISLSKQLLIRHGTCQINPPPLPSPQHQLPPTLSFPSDYSFCILINIFIRIMITIM